LIKEKGRATNSQIVKALGGNRELFKEVREFLILNELAKDMKRVGLAYIGAGENNHQTLAERQTSTD